MPIDMTKEQIQNALMFLEENRAAAIRSGDFSLANAIYDKMIPLYTKLGEMVLNMENA